MQDKPLRLEDFADKVGQDFCLSEPGMPRISFSLKQTEALPTGRVPFPRPPPFSLIFNARTPVVLPQRLYRLEHAIMGALTIFLVPVGRSAEGVNYQALFN